MPQTPSTWSIYPGGCNVRGGTVRKWIRHAVGAYFCLRVRDTQGEID